VVGLIRTITKLQQTLSTLTKLPMELTKQVCSLELAKELKRLGVKQESFFHWVADLDRAREENPDALEFDKLRCQISIEELPIEDGTKIHPHIKLASYGKVCSVLSVEAYSAFTVAELGEILEGRPDALPTKYIDGMWKKHALWNEKHGEKLVQAETEADARAKMLVYLLSQGLLAI